MLGFLLAVAVSASAAESKPPRLFFVAEAAPRISAWVPGIKSPVVHYGAEALSTYEASAIIGFDDAAVGRFSYERPFSSSPRQHEMLAAKESSQSGAEKYTAGIDLFPIIGYFFPEIAEKYIYKTLASVQFFHSRSMFYGNARAKEAFVYFPKEASLNPATQVVSGAKKIPQGSGIEFRTRFEENEITFAFYRSKQYAVRAGYYALSWERPTDAPPEYIAISQGTAHPIVQHARYTTQGLAVAVRNEQPSHPGLNGELEARLGFSNKIKAALERRLGEDQSLAFFSLAGGAWYNWYVKPKKRGLFFTLGGTADLRHWQIETKDAEGKTTASESVDSERLFTAWVSAGWKF